MTSFESKIGKIPENEETVFRFLSDFRNLPKIIPADKIKNWRAGQDHCRFTVEGFGDTGMKIIGKEPNTLIKITGDAPYSIDFIFWIQIRQVQQMDSRIRLTLKAELNAVVKMMIQGSAKLVLDKLVEYLETVDYSSARSGT